MGVIEGSNRFTNPLSRLRSPLVDIIRATTVADSWLNAYLLGNKAYPQVRIGTQVLITGELLNSISHIQHYSLSRLSPDQITGIGEEMSINHHNYGVPVASVGSHNQGDTVVSSSRYVTLWHQDKIGVVNGLRQMIGLSRLTIFPDDKSANGLPSTALLNLHRSAQELTETIETNPDQIEAIKSNTQTAKEVLYGKNGQFFSIFYKMVLASQYRKDRAKLLKGKNSSFWMEKLNLNREVLFAMTTENLRILPFVYFNQAVADLGLNPADYLWLQPQTD